MHTAGGWIRACASVFSLFFFVGMKSKRTSYRLDLAAEKMTCLGQHENGVSAINYAREQSVFSFLSVQRGRWFGSHEAWRTDVLITGSWDQSLRFWDPRAESAEVSSHAVPERVYQMDLVNNTLVVAMASRLFHIYDVRKMGEPAQTRESSLKFMTRSLACMADGQGTLCALLPIRTLY